jgi:cyanophycinase
VTVIDGTTIKSSNVSELRQDEILAITGVTVHILPQGYGYDLLNRKVIRF